MATSNRFSNIRQRFTSDSVSWGSLLILCLGIAALVVFMMLYSQGWMMKSSFIA